MVCLAKVYANKMLFVLTKMKNIYLLIILIIASFFIGTLFTKIDFLDKQTEKGYVADEQENYKLNPVISSPTLIPSTPTSINTPTQNSSPTKTSSQLPEAQTIKGSTPDGVALYDRIEAMNLNGEINGDLFTEFESDAIVDVNPDKYSVQLGLKYYILKDKITDVDKKLIEDDFNTIRRLVEQDKRLINPITQTLDVFVITFHDKTGKARGEVGQLVGDDQPVWSFWK